MPTEYVQVDTPVPGHPDVTYRELHRWRSWEHSERGPDGKLILKPHPYACVEKKIWNRRTVPGYPYAVPTDVPEFYAGIFPTWSTDTELANDTCYAKFRGKLYEGSANLGVTLAQWRQSHATLLRLYKALRSTEDDLMRYLAKKSYSPTEAANLHLEYVFGVLPTYQDVLATANTVIQMADQYDYIRASHKVMSSVEEPDKLMSNFVRVTFAAQVKIPNPNLWLAERAGLINLARVGWDLVPWSFLVNMFVNTNQLVQSLTDFVGLEFSDFNKTTTLVSRGIMRTPPDYPVSCTQMVQRLQMNRELGTHPELTGTLRFRVPAFSWGRVAIAASLATQRLMKNVGTLELMKLSLAEKARKRASKRYRRRLNRKSRPRKGKHF